MVARVSSSDASLGWWSPNGSPPVDEIDEIRKAIAQIRQSVTVVRTEDGLALGLGGVSRLGGTESAGGLPIVGYAAALPLENLGDPSFCSDHGLRYPYVSGAMANGIASVELVEAMGKAGMLGFFGAAGLAPERVEAELDRIQATLNGKSFGFNLIHSPNEPDIEAEVADLYLRRKVRLVEASAYLALTLPVVRYRVLGIYRDAEGFAVAPNRVVAKVSRVEVATKFLSPPPKKFLDELVNRGEITLEQAEMAEEIPMAQDLTAEADSGGHTDNRPAMALLPAMLALAERIQEQRGYAQRLRVGAAGGLSSPSSVAAAFAMGAAYVVTGSINQSCLEAGTSEQVRKMLATAQQADVAMAPAADMFEMGVKVQVLKRGTMFPMRARKLFELFRAHESLESLPANEREKLEKQFFRCTLEEAWSQTRAFFERRDPAQNERAERDPRHKMSLVFRSYLGQSSKWANSGEPTRVADYQIWCGPAMGAFNEWVKDSFLEGHENRKVASIGMNLLYGAALTLRLNTLRSQGIRLPAEAARCRPLSPDALATVLSE